MRLSDAALEAVRLAVTDVMTRPLTTEEVFDEVVRLVREAQTPEQIHAVGTLIGRVTWLGKQFPRTVAGPTDDDPKPPSPAAPPADEPAPAEEGRHVSEPVAERVA